MTRLQHSAVASFVTLLVHLATTSLAAATPPHDTTVPKQQVAAEHAEVGHVASEQGSEQRVANQENADSSGALEQVFHAADKAFQAANYRDAARLFTRVWQLAQSPQNAANWGHYTAIFAYNAATSYRLAKDCQAAHWAFSHYATAFNQLSSQQQVDLRDATDLPRDNDAWLKDLTQECPNPATAAPAFGTVEPNHEPTAWAPEPASATGNWLLDVNLPAKVSPTLPPVDNTPSVRSSVSHVGWLLASGGVASLAVSGYFLWSGVKNNNEASAPANKHRPYEDHVAVRDRDYVAAGLFGALGLGLTGVGVYLLAPPQRKSGTTQGISESKLWLFTSGTQLGVAGQL